MAILLKANGEHRVILDHKFELEELYQLLDCSYIDILYVAGDKILIIDDEGKLTGKSVNSAATEVYENRDVIVGDALFCESKWVD